jgi:hypothetical protein
MKIKILKYCVLEKIIGKVCVEKYNLSYNIISSLNNSKLNLNKKSYGQINKQINNSTEKNFEIIDNMNEQDKVNLEIEMDKILNVSFALNEDEITKRNFLYNAYDEEYKRVLKIKENFIENYIDADKLKNAHLGNNCGKRKTTRSKCNIRDFLNSIQKQITLKNIKEKYCKISNENGIFPIKMNDKNAECFYIITQIYDLFEKYLLIIDYCLKLIDEIPQVIRDPNIFLFDIENKTNYFFEEEYKNAIHINNMNTILNISVQENNVEMINENSTVFVKFYETETRNNVVFYATQ